MHVQWHFPTYVHFSVAVSRAHRFATIVIIITSIIVIIIIMIKHMIIILNTNKKKSSSMAILIINSICIYTRDGKASDEEAPDQAPHV